MNRSQKNIASVANITTNINKYTAMVEESLSLFFKGVKKIIKYSVEVDKAKHSIMVDYNRSFDKLFEDMTSNSHMIPS